MGRGYRPARPPVFRFPFRGGQSKATGHYNAPTHGSSRPMPPIKQFTPLRRPSTRKRR